MARVPQYQQQLAPTVTPMVRRSDNNASAEDFGGGLAKAAGAFAGVAQQIAKREQEKADTAAQMEIENGLAALETQTLYDPDKGMLNRQGKDAIGLGQQFAPAWEQGAAGIVGKAPRHLQGWAQQQAAARQQQASRILMRHSAQEADKYYTGQAKSLIDNAASAAVLNFADPERVEQEVGRAMIAADRLADLQGADAITREQARKGAASSVQRAVLERIAATDPYAAMDRLASVRDTLTGEDVTRVESVLRPVLTDATADAVLTAWMGGGDAPAGLAIEGAAKTVSEVEAVAIASVERTIGLESGGKADAKNPASSATGAAQFTAATWIDVVSRNRPDLAGLPRAELLALRNDPVLSKEMATAYAIENCKGLYESGLPVTPETAYLGHHFGLDGARKILRADPGAPIQEVIDGRAYAANKYLHGKTVGEVIGNHAKRAGEDPVAPTGKPDYAALLQRAQAIPNPLLRERVTAKIDRQRIIAERAEAETERAMVDRTYTAIETADPTLPLEQIIGPEALAWARKEGRVSAMESRLQSRLAGRVVQSDPVLVDAYAREAVLSPESFLKRDVRAQADKLATGDLARLLKLQADMRDPDKREKARADWSSEQDRIDAGLRLLGLEAVRGNPKVNEAERGQFRLFYQQAEAAFIQSQGKKPTPEQADALLREVVTRVARNPDLLKAASAAERFALGGEVRGASGPVKLSEHDRQTVVAVLRMRGNPNPTEAQIVAAAGAYYASP